MHAAENRLPFIHCSVGMRPASTFAQEQRQLYCKRAGSASTQPSSAKRKLLRQAITGLAFVSSVIRHQCDRFLGISVSSV